MSQVSKTVFQFKHFEIHQEHSSMKIGTDGVLLGAWADVSNCKEALDIGTGTGVIALMLAQRNLESDVHAVEIDNDSFEEAEYNFKNAHWNDRMRCFHYSIQDFTVATEQRYDLIVCNPPFFTGGTLSDAYDRNAVRHTIKLPHGELLISVRQLLKKAGKFCVILPFLEGLRFKEMAQSNGLFCNKTTGVKPDLLKPVERLLMEFSFKVSDYKYNEMCIRNEHGNYSRDYKSLTKEFYLEE